MSQDPSILDSLNEEQRKAVCAPFGNLLVLAGAGSGKTRVLVHRIAWLIQEESYSPFSIMAVTFTNKAAAEIRSRIESLLQINASSMWVGTFHGLAHRLLRSHWMDAGLSQNFQILDIEDQKRVLRRIIKSLNLDENRWSVKEALWFINSKKDEGKRSKDLVESTDFYIHTMGRIYEEYEDVCRKGDLVDFAELLLRAHELWQNNPTILEHYQQRFRSILVDEFQDTNTIQYSWIRLLAHDKNQVMIVGDDDQSIYGWRGAKIENIRKFNKDFPNSLTIMLEQNYRSTGTILKAANSLISNNRERMGKKLWSSGEAGTPIFLYAAFNEIDEAKFISEKVLSWASDGNLRSDIAVLYRSNAQSRVIEEALIQAMIPYRVYGGLRFFERAEIKDALAYMRLVAHNADDTAFERVINKPTRGIGERTLEEIRSLAKEKECSLWNASEIVIEQNRLSPRATGALSNFINLINSIAEETKDKNLSTLTECALKISGLWDFYISQKGEKARSRVENLEELISAAKHFVKDSDIEETELQSFINHAALEAGEAQGDDNQDCVQLMTLHSAKGLEFPLVFMVGVEEGVFPSRLSIDEDGRLEEERRLCYVGMTRAMQQLYITYAELRRLYGKEEYHKVSRFVDEVDPSCISEIRKKISVSRPSRSDSKFRKPTTYKSESTYEKSGLNLGQRVTHKKFGEGVLINVEGSGPHTRVQVEFDSVGAKWLVLSYAMLEPLSLDVQQ